MNECYTEEIYFLNYIICCMTTNLYLIPIQRTYSILLKLAAVRPQNATECFKIDQSLKSISVPIPTYRAL